MNLDFMPISPITLPPDLEWMLRHPQYLLLAGAIGFALIAAWLLFAPAKRGFVARLGGLTWRRNQFCRGWLITGDTGSGKTSSGINQLAHQVFQNEPTWGGLCIDEKGVYWETLAAMARHYGREHDLIHLQIRSNDADIHWTPPHRYNLTGDRSIPDYDPVGLSEFLRLSERLGGAVSLHLPDNLETLFRCYSKRSLLADTKNQRMLMELRRAQHPSVRRVVALMDEFNGGLEHEAIFIKQEATQVAPA